MHCTVLCSIVLDLRSCDRKTPGSILIRGTNADAPCNPFAVGHALSTKESRGVNEHTTRCASAVSVVFQQRLVSG